MKTGKIIIGCAFLVFMSVSLSSCSMIIRAVRNKPRNVMVAPDMPIVDTAVIKIDYYIFVKEYNGINVESEWYSNDRLKTISATIPAGETHLLFDIYMVFTRNQATYSFRPKDIELKYDFEPGRKYRVGMFTENIGNFIFPRRKIFLAIWDMEPAPGSGKEPLRSWELSEIPF